MCGYQVYCGIPRAIPECFWWNCFSKRRLSSVLSRLFRQTSGNSVLLGLYARTCTTDWQQHVACSVLINSTRLDVTSVKSVTQSSSVITTWFSTSWRSLSMDVERGFLKTYIKFFQNENIKKFDFRFLVFFCSFCCLLCKIYWNLHRALSLGSVLRRLDTVDLLRVESTLALLLSLRTLKHKNLKHLYNPQK